MNEVKVDISGTVVSDPVLRSTRAGEPFLSFRVAVNPRRWNAEDGTWSDGDAQFFSVTAFRALAGNAYHSLSKGQQVMVSGRLRMTRYEARDGAVRTSVQVDAHDIGASLKFGQTAFTKCLHPVVPSHDRLADAAVSAAVRELEEGASDEAPTEAAEGPSETPGAPNEPANAPRSDDAASAALLAS